MTTDVDPRVIRRRADQLVKNHREFMERLVAMRHTHRLTQAEVAERMGVSQPTVAAFERYDSNPTLSTIRRYALAVDALLDDQVIDDCGSCVSGRDTDATIVTQESLPLVLGLQNALVHSVLLSEPFEHVWSTSTAWPVRVTDDFMRSTTRAEAEFGPEPDDWERTESRSAARSHA